MPLVSFDEEWIVETLWRLEQSRCDAEWSHLMLAISLASNDALQHGLTVSRLLVEYAERVASASPR